MRFRTFARRAYTTLRFVARHIPTAFTLIERLFVYRFRYRDPGDHSAGFEQVRLQLVPLETRLVPDGRPLPAPVIFAGSGTSSLVRGYDAQTGDLNFEVNAFDFTAAGGVHVAAGDFNGDGYPDALVAAGPGGMPLLRVLDGKTGDPLSGPLGGFMAFPPTFLGGVSVAAADVDGDGATDIIAAATMGDGPEVRVFSGANGQQIAHFDVTGSDFSGGITIAAADLTGDGQAEIAVGAGPGGAPRVNIYNPFTGTTISGPLGSFLAFDSSFHGGVSLGADALAGDVDGDGTPDLAVGSGPGMTATVHVYSGSSGDHILSLSPFGSTDIGGARVGLAYVNDDAFADVVTGTGPGVTAAIRVFDGHSGDQLDGAIGSYTPFGTSTGGVSIGSSNDPLPQVEISADADANEGGTDGYFDLTRSTTGLSSSLTVYFTLSGTATDGVDYTASPSASSVTFAADESSARVSISAVSDGITDPDESVTLTLSSSSSYEIGTTGYGGSDSIIIVEPSSPPPPPPPPPPGSMGSIGDYVWYDSDHDGVQDIDEYGAAGITVTLSGGSLSATETATTGYTGYYNFTGLDAGEYTLDFAAPPGYGFSTPSGGEETLSLSTGEMVTSADAGLVPPPILGGKVIVPIKGYNFHGTVAEMYASTSVWVAGDLDATIEWGDGTSSTGVLVSSGDTISVTGDHTYTHEGAYALAVKVSAPGIPGVKNFAAGLAEVLAPTDHQELEAIGDASVTVSGGWLGGFATLLASGAFTATGSGSADYTLRESGDETGDAFSLTRIGTVNFSLKETGSDFSQPDSTLDLSLSETSTKTEEIRTPQEYGTATQTGSVNYTLSQTGSGADYNWNMTNGRISTSDNPTVTVADGTFTSWDSDWITLLESGENDASGSTYWLSSSSGGETMVHSESGFRGPESFSDVRNSTGGYSESESGGFWDDSFVRGESHSGTYTLTESSSNPGGTHTASGTGDYTGSFSGNGTDPGGVVTYVTTNTDSGYTGTATDTQTGAVTTATENRSDSDTQTTTGDESTGAFTLTHTTGNGETATATTTNQGVTSTQITTAGNSNTTVETGTTGVGAYTLSGTGSSSSTETGTSVYLGESASWGSSSGSTITSTENGDRIAGDFTLTVTATTTSSSSDGTTQTATQTGGGVTGQHARGSSDGGTQTQTATTTRTGNLSSGAYSLHETSTTTTTASDSATDDTGSTGTLGSTEDNDQMQADRETVTGTATLDRSGNALSGTYSLHEVSSSGVTETDSATDDVSALPGDGEDDEDVVTDAATSYQTSGGTLDRTGNEVSGSYSEHQVSSSTVTTYGTSTDSVNDHAANGSEDDDVNVDLTTAYQITTSTMDRTGNEVTGDYSQSVVETSSGSEFAAETDTISDLLANGEDDEDVVTDNSSAYQTSTATITGTGNDITGVYSRFRTETSSGSSFETSTATATDDLADGSVDRDRDVEQDTAYQSSTRTITSNGNEVTGSFYEYEDNTENASDFVTGTDTATDSQAGGNEYDNLMNSLRTLYQTSGYTFSNYGNFISGDYTKHEVTSSSNTDYDSDTDTTTDFLRDTSEDDAVDVGQDTMYESGGSTVDATGNELSGDYSLHEYDSSSESEYGTETDTSTDHPADSSTVKDVLTRYSSLFDSGSSVLDRYGNGLTGSYSLHETSSDFNTDYLSDTDTGTDFLFDGSTEYDTGSDTSTDSEYGGSTLDENGNAVTGEYSALETDSSTDNSTAGGSNGSTEYLSGGGGEQLDSGNSLSTNFLTSGSTTTRIGSAITGLFSVHEVSSMLSSMFGASTDTPTSELTGEDEQDETDIDFSTAYQTSGSTVDENGSEVTGDSTSHETDTSTSTTSDSATDSVVLDGATTTQTNSDNATQSDNGNETQIENAITGNYTTYETGTDTPTDSDNSSDQGLSDTGTTTGLDTWTLSESGNEFTGAYTITRIDTHDATTPMSGTDARGTYTGTETDHSNSTDTEHGNNISGTHTDVVTGTSDSTVTTTGGDGTTAYSRTEIGSDSSSTSQTWSDDTDITSEVMTDTASSTVNENGTTSTTNYSFVEVDGSTTTDTDTSNSVSGMSTLTHVASSTSSLHEEADEGTAGEYTIDKTTGNASDTTRIADAQTGDYTLSGVTGMTSTAIESNIHGADSALFTEILTEDTTLAESGNDQAGQYQLSESGTRTANFVDDGTNASGSFEVTESSTGTFDRTTTGDSNSGATQIDVSSSTDYSVTEIVSGSSWFTLTENGTDAMTTVETDDTVTGDYSIGGNGMDLYTLGESGTLGGVFSDSVTGTDVYASTETGNHNQQTYDRTTTGGGDWTRTASGGSLSSDSRTNTYTLTESGDQAAGHFSQDESGADRYGLVQSFDDVSNTGSGSTPGNVTFHSHGLVFQDPGDGDDNKWPGFGPDPVARSPKEAVFRTVFYQDFPGAPLIQLELRPEDPRTIYQTLTGKTLPESGNYYAILKSNNVSVMITGQYRLRESSENKKIVTPQDIQGTRIGWRVMTGLIELPEIDRETRQKRQMEASYSKKSDLFRLSQSKPGGYWGTHGITEDPRTSGPVDMSQFIKRWEAKERKRWEIEVSKPWTQEAKISRELSGIIRSEAAGAERHWEASAKNVNLNDKDPFLGLKGTEVEGTFQLAKDISVGTQSRLVSEPEGLKFEKPFVILDFKR